MDTTFVNQVTLTDAGWFNDINKAIYRALGSTGITGGTPPVTPSDVLNNLAANGSASAIAALMSVLGSPASSVPALHYNEGGTGAVTRTLQTKLQESVSVLDFGADPTGAVASATAINAAITSLPASGGQVIVPAGTYLIDASIIMSTGVYLVGQGSKFTTFLAKATTTTPVIQTKNFATLTGTNSPTGPYAWAIIGITIDGNKSGRASGNNLSIYGYDYILRDVISRNSAAIGIYSEWALSATVPVAAGGDSMEAHWYNIKSWNSVGDGIDFNGPHDSTMVDVVTYLNGGTGVAWGQTANYSGACVVDQFHSYGNALGAQIGPTTVLATGFQIESNKTTGGLLIQSGATFSVTGITAYSNVGYGISNQGATDIHMSNVRSEGNTGDGFVNTGAGVTVDNGLFYGNGGYGINGVANNCVFTGVFAQNNTGGGIQVVNGASNIYLSGQSSSNTGTQLVLNTLGGGNVINMTSFTAGGQTGYSGTPGATNSIFYISIGASNQVLNQIYATSNGVAALAINQTRSTGGTAPVLTANKPGASTGIGAWVPILLDGTTYWIPAWSN